MIRRATTIALLTCGIVLADPATDAWDLFASMASALTEYRNTDPRLPPLYGNAEAFLKGIDPKMSGYGQLSADIHAMVEQSQVESDIQPALTNEGDDHKRTVVLDWTLRMKRPTPDGGGQIDTREQIVTFHVEKQGKKWRVTSIDPLNFFRPPKYQ